MSNVDSPDFWQEKYQSNDFPWDLGRPSPVFTRLAESGQLAPGKMVVLGAGRGHDARLFARHGFDVTAVDFASAAAAAMRQQNDPQHPVAVVQADIFALPAAWNGRFDYVLEYTCYCAIDPARRGDYGQLVSRLLKPGGRWVALAFPIGRRPGGPPFVVQPDRVVERFVEHGFSLLHRELPPDSPPARTDIEALLIMQKNGAITENGKKEA